MTLLEARTKHPWECVVSTRWPYRADGQGIYGSSKRNFFRWPARSPDFTPCDFFHWEYLKAEVFKHKPQKIDKMKDSTLCTITTTPETSVEEFQDETSEYITREGRHLNDTIFKTVWWKSENKMANLTLSYT